MRVKKFIALLGATAIFLSTTMLSTFTAFAGDNNVGSNLIVNGDFETGNNTGWLGNGFNGFGDESTEGGKKCAYSWLPTELSYQIVALEAGKSYSLSFDAKLGSEGEQALNYGIQKEDGSVDIFKRSLSNLTTSFTKQTLNFRMTVSGNYRVYFQGTVAGDPRIDIDSIALYEQKNANDGEEIQEQGPVVIPLVNPNFDVDPFAEGGGWTKGDGIPSAWGSWHGNKDMDGASGNDAKCIYLATAPGADAYAYQEVTLEAGKTYELSAWTRIEYSWNTCNASVAIYDGDKLLQIATNSLNNNSYRQVSLSFAPSETKKYQIRLIADAASEGYYPQFDSVLLVEKNEKAFTPLVNGNFDVDPFGENGGWHKPSELPGAWSSYHSDWDIDGVNSPDSKSVYTVANTENGDGYIYQDVTLVSGFEYVLSGSSCLKSGWKGSTSLAIYDGTKEVAVAINAVDSNKYESMTCSFIPTESKTYQIRLIGHSDSGTLYPMFDSITLSQTIASESYGEEMLVNGKFDVDPFAANGGWDKQAEIPGAWSSYHGNWDIDGIASPDSKSIYVVANTENGDGYVCQNINLTAGSTYKFSGYSRLNSDWKGAASLALYDGNTQVAIAVNDNGKKSDQFEEMTFAYTAKETKTYQLRLIAHSDSGTVYVMFDSISCVEKKSDGAQTNQLIANPGFSLNGVFWNIFSGNVENEALHLEGSHAPYARQDNIAVNGNEIYEIKVGSVAGSREKGTYELAANGKVLVTVYKQGTTTVLGRLEVPFSGRTPVTDSAVQFEMPAAVSAVDVVISTQNLVGAVNIDDVTMTKAGTVDPNTFPSVTTEASLFTGDSFDKADLDGNWVTKGQYALDNGTVKLGSGAAFLVYNVKLFGGNQYKLTAKAKIGNSGQTAVLGLRKANGNEDYTAAAQVTATEWTDISLTFTTGADDVSGLLYLTNANVDGVVFFDDVKLSIVEPDMEAVSPKTFVFEKEEDLKPWNVRGNHQWIVQTYDEDGNPENADGATLELGTGLSIAALKVKVNPNSRYFLEVISKTMADQQLNIGIREANEVDSYYTVAHTSYAADQIWFETGAEAQWAILKFQTANTNGKAWIQSVKVQEYLVDSDANLVKNGGFEKGTASTEDTPLQLENWTIKKQTDTAKGVNWDEAPGLARNGKYSINLGAELLVQQRITNLEKGATYRLSAYGTGGDKGAQLRIGALEYSGDDAYAYTDGSPRYTEACVEFTLGENDTEVTIELACEGTGDLYVRVDDVTMTKVKDGVGGNETPDPGNSSDKPSTPITETGVVAVCGATTLLLLASSTMIVVRKKRK